MTANIGDFIIKGVSDEFYPCKPDIFEKTYELVEQDESLLLSGKEVIFMFKFSELISKVTVKKIDSSNENLVTQIMKYINE